MPYVWLLFEGAWSSDYYWYWLKRWPVLPGLPSLLVARPLGMETATLELTAITIGTLMLFAVGTLIGRRSHRWLLCVCIVYAMYGGWMCFVTQAVYRA
jgi:hypothetical protein